MTPDDTMLLKRWRETYSLVDLLEKFGMSLDETLRVLVLQAQAEQREKLILMFRDIDNDVGLDVCLYCGCQWKEHDPKCLIEAIRRGGGLT